MKLAKYFTHSLGLHRVDPTRLLPFVLFMGIAGELVTDGGGQG